MREATTLLPPILLLGVVLQRATSHAAGGWELAAACLAVLVLQVLPGVVVWRAIRPVEGWLVEDLAIGFALGAAFAVAAQVASTAWSAGWLAWLLPLLLGGLLVVSPPSRRRIMAARCRPLPWLWGAAVAAAAVLPAVQAMRFFDEPVRWSGWAAPYVDLPYHLALAGETAHRWPLHYPQLAGEPLEYHWFAHAWVAHVSGISGTSLDVVLLRMMPAVIAVAVPVAVAAAAVRISRSAWAGAGAAATAFAFVELDLWHAIRPTVPVSGYSPTLGFAALMLVPALVVLVSRWRGAIGWGGFAVLVPLLVVVGGSKGTALPVLVCGCLLASAAVQIWRTRWNRRVLLDTAVAVVALLLLMVVVFKGGDSGATVEPLRSLADTRGAPFAGAGGQLSAVALAATVITTMITLFAGSAGVAVLLLDSSTRRDPGSWLLAGCGAAGAGAILVLNHPGLGQWYFLRSAEVPLSIGAAWGVSHLLRHTNRPRWSTLIGVAVGVSAAVLTLSWVEPLRDADSRIRAAVAALALFALLVIGLSALAGLLLGGHRRGSARTAPAVAVMAVTVAGVVPAASAALDDATQPEPRAVTATTRGAFHADQVRAARWIRDHSDPDDLVMTNRHCRGVERRGCDAARFFVAAYSERGVLLEGWAFTKQANARASELGVEPRTIPFWDPDLQELSDRFITEPDSDAARRLRELGVRWVFVDPAAPHAPDLRPFAERRLRNDHATVYELTP